MNLIKFIRSEIRNVILEDFKFQYKNNKGTFIPPSDVIGTARRALEAVGKNKMVKSNGSNEGSGLQKAKTLAEAEPMTHQQLKRMKAFFDNNIDKVEQARRAGETFENSEILQKWDLWGGDAGNKWVNTKIQSTRETNTTSKKVRANTKWEKLMDPYNTRTSDVNSLYVNKMNEASIGHNGELDDFSFEMDEEERADAISEIIKQNWHPVEGNSRRREKNYDWYEYWLSPDLKSSFDMLGYECDFDTVTNKEHPDYGKTFLIVYWYDVKK